MKCCGGGANLGKHEWNCPRVKAVGYGPPRWRKPFMWRIRMWRLSWLGGNQ